MKRVILIAIAALFSVTALAAQDKVERTVWGTKITFKKIQKTRNPASTSDAVDVLKTFTNPGYVAFVRHAAKLKFSEASKNYLGELVGLSPAEYFKKMLFDYEGPNREQRIPSAFCEPVKKGVRACTLSILFETEIQTTDTPSGVETFESSIVFQFTLDAKGNVIRNGINLLVAG